MGAKHSGEPSIDVSVVAREALLMDTLSRGEAPPADDEIGLLLAAWRDNLAADVPAEESTHRRMSPWSISAMSVARPARSGRSRRVALAAAAVLVLVGGVTVVAAAQAGPDSPLWSITRVLYGERADARIAERAEQAIAQARRALADKRYVEAGQRLDDADALVDGVRDPVLARRLRDEIRALRGLLRGPGGHPLPGANPTPTVATTPSPGVSQGGSAPTTAPGLPLPSLSLPIPLPTLPIHLPPLLRPAEPG